MRAHFAFVASLLLLSCSTSGGGVLTSSSDPSTLSTEDESGYFFFERQITLPKIGLSFFPPGPLWKLWGDAAIPDEIPEKTQESLIVGDALTIVSKEDLYVRETYPEVVVFVNHGYVRCFATQCEVVEVNIEEGRIFASNRDIDFSKLLTGEFIITAEDEVVPLEDISRAYATLSTFEENVAVALYAENPRA